MATIRAIQSHLSRYAYSRPSPKGSCNSPVRTAIAISALIAITISNTDMSNGFLFSFLQQYTDDTRAMATRRTLTMDPHKYSPHTIETMPAITEVTNDNISNVECCHPNRYCSPVFSFMILIYKPL